MLRTNVQRHVNKFIPEEKQMSISQIVDATLEQYNLIPQDPGSKVDLDHLQPERRQILEKLILRLRLQL